MNIIFLEDEKPIVECSFITEFEDHIFVTVDAESFFFLHDLITSYLQEKERVVSDVFTWLSKKSRPVVFDFSNKIYVFLL